MPRKEESARNVAEPVVVKAPERKLMEANSLVNKRVLASVAVGLAPIPLLDLAAITGVQLDMIWELSRLYELPFRRDLGKSILSSLVGGALPVSMNPAIASLIKSIPVIGQTTGALSLSIIAGATTYAVGKVFIQHFEAGGTLLNFDPEKVREFYTNMYKEGIGVAKKADTVQ